MFRTLIVPLDGSEQAERALPYAVRLAETGNGRLVLVRAALGPPPSGQNWEDQQTAAVDEANEYVAEVARKLATRVPVPRPRSRTATPRRRSSGASSVSMPTRLS